jgi:hypothetical protein
MVHHSTIGTNYSHLFWLHDKTVIDHKWYIPSVVDKMSQLKKKKRIERNLFGYKKS